MDIFGKRTAHEAGAILFDRFEVQSCLGMGQFGATYRAFDRERENFVAVKELLPPTSERTQGGFVSMQIERAASGELRRRFLAHATVLGKIRCRGLLPTLNSFEQFGTAYYVLPLLESTTSLDQLIRAGNPMPSQQLVELAVQGLEILGNAHVQTRHQDIRPSNLILVGETWHLIDPGSAREWEADRTVSHDVLYLARYAPSELLRRHSGRSHATDLYQFCACVFHAAMPHCDFSQEELDAADLLEAERPDLSPGLKKMLEFGMKRALHERARSAHELLRLLRQEEKASVLLSMADFDQVAVKLESLRFQVRQCPACRVGVLERPKPLKPLQCPVCRQAQVRIRTITPGLCPMCRDGKLIRIENEMPNGVCPACNSAILVQIKRGWTKRSAHTVCPDCGIEMVPQENGWQCAGDKSPTEEIKSSAEWRKFSNRSAVIHWCRGCGAQFDETEDGRRFLAVPANSSRFGALLPEQWDRIAHHMPARGGNAECAGCGSDYLIIGDSMTLIAPAKSYAEEASHLLDRHLTIQEVQWLGVGKTSRLPGLVCLECATEFDAESPDFRLVQSKSEALFRYEGKTLPFEHWHRLGMGLPLPDEIKEFELGFEKAILEAYCSGEIGLEHPKRNDLLWDANAVLTPSSSDGTAETADERTARLTITQDELVFGNLFRKLRIPIHELRGAALDGDRITLTLAEDEYTFQLDPAKVSVILGSGVRKVQVEPEHLLRRLNQLLNS